MADGLHGPSPLLRVFHVPGQGWNQTLCKGGGRVYARAYIWLSSWNAIMYYVWVISRNIMRKIAINLLVAALNFATRLGVTQHSTEICRI